MVFLWLRGHSIRDPTFADVKLAQATCLREEAAQIWHRLVKSIDAHREDDDLDKCAAAVPIILGGDFNSMVDSDVYAVMTGGSGSEGDRLPQLTSAYGTGLWRQGDGSDAPTPLVPKAGVSVLEPPLTTCTPGFTETIDYIFSAGVQVTAVRPLPTRESLGKGTPNGDHPSDHLPIVAEMQL